MVFDLNRYIGKLGAERSEVISSGLIPPGEFDDVSWAAPGVYLAFRIHDQQFQALGFVFDKARVELADVFVRDDFKGRLPQPFASLTHRNDVRCLADGEEFRVKLFDGGYTRFRYSLKKAHGWPGQDVVLGVTYDDQGGLVALEFVCVEASELLTLRDFYSRQ